MNEDQTQPVPNATDTQTQVASGSTEILDKSAQQNVANSESVVNQEQSQNLLGQNVKENTTYKTPQETPADTSTIDKSVKTANNSKSVGTETTSDDATKPVQVKDDVAQPTTPSIENNQQSTSANNPADQEKTVVDNPNKATSTSTAEPPKKKLSDVVPSTTVWISGMVGNKQYDCAGPFEAPFKIDKPTWPYVNFAPNPEYTNQVFDYDKGEWVPTDAKSQGQLLTDLAKQVTTLKDDSQKHDQTADQSQKMGMQLTKVMMQLSSKVDALNTKIDGIVNDKKDGDK